MSKKKTKSLKSVVGLEFFDVQSTLSSFAVIDMWYHLVETLRIEPKWVNLSETFSVESPLHVLRVVISGLFSSRKIEICKVNLA